MMLLDFRSICLSVFDYLQRQTTPVSKQDIEAAFEAESVETITKCLDILYKKGCVFRDNPGNYLFVGGFSKSPDNFPLHVFSRYKAGDTLLIGLFQHNQRVAGISDLPDDIRVRLMNPSSVATSVRRKGLLENSDGLQITEAGYQYLKEKFGLETPPVTAPTQNTNEPAFLS
jgi:hypothetical protein